MASSGTTAASTRTTARPTTTAVSAFPLPRPCRAPSNRQLARGARLRVPAETARDIQLATSGLLDGAIGGRSVFPPAPDYLFQRPVSYRPKTWDVETDSNRYRRALYTFRFRSVPYPMLAAFDAPPGAASCVRRNVSTSPMQALVTLNEQVSVEAALGLAHLILSDTGSVEERLARAFRRCTSRVPDAGETAALISVYEFALAADPAEAKLLRDNHQPVTLDLSVHPLPELAAPPPRPPPTRRRPGLRRFRARRRTSSSFSWAARPATSTSSTTSRNSSAWTGKQLPPSC